ncbi:MAG: hypothetical protein ACI9FB_004237 [Candidatus Azotimanducaceae bacterium]|jgi:hypothetical protein
MKRPMSSAEHLENHKPDLYPTSTPLQIGLCNSLQGRMSGSVTGEWSVRPAHGAFDRVKCRQVLFGQDTSNRLIKA